MKNINKAYDRKIFDFSRNEIQIKGLPRPWFNYSAIQFLDTIEFQNKKIFEWGAGNSTRYFKARGAIIESVENNKNWASSLSKELNTQVYLMDTQENYCQKLIRLNKHFDVVIIDGEFREDCAEVLMQYTQKFSPSLLIFDNSDWYPKSIAKLLSNSNWIPVFINGFAPLVTYETQTLFLIAKEFNLEFISGIRPLGTIIVD
jgi:hypothetical protein